MVRCSLMLTMFCCGCLVLPATAATLPDKTPAHAPSGSPGSPSKDQRPKLCFDALFYRALPGKVNYCLGLMEWNRGHYRNALELLKLAAGWGDKNAQYTLGLIYYSGHHVKADVPLGIAWFKLANERHGDAQIALATKSATKWATPTERQQAEQLFQQMHSKYGDKVAATRAWHHLQHWKMGRGPFAGGCVFLYGAQGYAATMGRLTVQGVTQSSLHTACVPFQVQRQLVRKSADSYFHDWMGTVNVGPLKQVPAPAGSSGN